MGCNGDLPVRGNNPSNSVPLSDAPPATRSSLLALFHRVASTWLEALCALVLFVGQFSLTLGVIGPDLDSSWNRALQECFKARAQAGTDYVFTYGPLGALASMIFDKQLFWYRYAWELAFSLITTVILVAFARRLRPRSLRFLFYGVVLFYLAWHSELRTELALLTLSVLLFVCEPRAHVLVLSGLFLSALSLVKFTFAVFAFPAILLISAWKWWETRNRIVLLLPLAYGVGLLGLWHLLGQALTNLPTFVRMSMEIAGGYVEAMSLAGSSAMFFRALTLIGIEVVLCLVLAWRSQQKMRFGVCLLLVLASLYLQFRHGFIRQDDEHYPLFFGFALTLPFVLVVVEPVSRGRWLFWPGFCLALFLALQDFSMIQTRYAPNLYRRTLVVWQTLRHNAEVLLYPGAYQANLEQQERAQARCWQLPRIKAVVGDHTIDIVSFRQGLLFLNELRWTPRPIFQSYSAHTPKLLAANQDFYRGLRAPEFVLFHLNAIDLRLPATEDGGVLLELLQHYRPVLTEKDYLLLRRRKPAGYPQVMPERTTEQTIHFGEEVPIPSSPDKYLTVSFQFDLRTSGRLLHALYRNPFLYLNLRLNDGSFRGYRLIPGLAAHEFLLSPLIEDSDDFVDLYGAKATKHVVALSITQQDFRGWRPYRSAIHMTLKTYPSSLIPQIPDSEWAPLSRLALLGTFPQRVEGHLRRVTVAKGRSALQVNQGTVTYALHPGQRRISGRYGIVPEDYGPGPKKDGVDFIITHVAPTGKKSVLFQRQLAPAESPADRGVHTFSVELPPYQRGGLIQLRTRDTASNTCFDWSYWSHITFSRGDQKRTPRCARPTLRAE